MDYIDRMIATREDNDETQRDLAQKIKYAQPQIARYETSEVRDLPLPKIG